MSNGIGLGFMFLFFCLVCSSCSMASELEKINSNLSKIAQYQNGDIRHE